MIKKHKNVCMALNYIYQSLILVSVITGFVSISDSASLADISSLIDNSAVR